MKSFDRGLRQNKAGRDLRLSKIIGKEKISANLFNKQPALAYA